MKTDARERLCIDAFRFDKSGQSGEADKAGMQTEK